MNVLAPTVTLYSQAFPGLATSLTLSLSPSWDDREVRRMGKQFNKLFILTLVIIFLRQNQE